MVNIDKVVTLTQTLVHHKIGSIFKLKICVRNLNLSSLKYNNLRPDYILHLETFSEDLEHLLTDVGLSQHKHLFPHTHTQRGGHSSNLTESFLSQLSTNQLLQLVDKYKLDLELFGYL